jgi:hypothetical protein
VTTVAVCGAVANKHRHGGSIWVRMSWAESLRALGFDVVFIEELRDAAAVDRHGRSVAPARSANAETFDVAMAHFGFGDACALLGEDGRSLRGLSAAELTARLRGAELLVNISGHLRRPELLALPRRRAFIDLDPGYTQVWQAEGRDIGLAGHDLYFTVGVNIGSRHCPLPTGGVSWKAIRQPVVLDRWPVVAAPWFTRFTTVASWRGAYGPLEWRGRRYGAKAHGFRELAELPRRTGLPFEIALDIDAADAADAVRLRNGGWRLTDAAATATTEGFARYVKGSGAEFSAAQGIYAQTRSGWVSDRTVRYLASGRPALIQDTGQDDALPVGAGLLTFRSPQEAGRRAAEIVADYHRHAEAARALAADWFTPRAALAPLLDAAELER